MTLSRRDAIRALGLGIAGSALGGRAPWPARAQEGLIRRTIPSSGERIPAVGLGSWRTFDVDPEAAEARDPLEVVRLFHGRGGRVIDTAPAYGRSEAFVGAALERFGIAEEIFVATKVNVQDAGLDAALEQMEASSRRLGRETVDLMQVWNLGDDFRELSDRYLDAHMAAVREWRSRGRCRYIGITTSFPRQYDAVARALERHEMDFVQIDYSIGDRVPEQRLLPLARERGVAVLVNRPFTSGDLFGRVRGAPLPEWTAEFGCQSWAQFFLEYILAHPAVTCVIPATGDPEHVLDNMGAGYGSLPDEAARQRMVRTFEAL